MCVDPSTVSRTLSLFNAIGNVQERKYPPNTGTAVLTEIDKSSFWKLLLKSLRRIYVRSNRHSSKRLELMWIPAPFGGFYRLPTSRGRR